MCLLLLAAAMLHSRIGHAYRGKFMFHNFQYAVWLPDTTRSADTASVVVQQTAPAIALNKQVVGFVASYLDKEAYFLEKIKDRSQSLFQTIEKVLAQYELPMQLKYLAVVESALHANARSAAGARGLWQLMPVTAKELGLRISGKTDERLHTQRSTIAAAKYLSSLYAEFGDWLLVLAAYNGGPTKVRRAMKKAGSKNFWALQRFLPAESRGHVKRFISIHYFFEGQGSIATQTRAEALAWEEKLCAEEEMLAAMLQ